ncbi:hypothetical protein SCHPADRAFT_947432 [Schizopora paradoxa]|uniref:Uncharacterized protein n=1 Tax=Schizopora paradoxa TaxID=27342 RepID=A0A0H2R0M7_9AGAM|nr:hypothetical protein SCHPADRAFT_947432 [Schizopora paradoxa]
MAIGMFAWEIQDTVFEMALSGSGHLRMDDHQLDALHALAAVGCEFFAKHSQAKNGCIWLWTRSMTKHDLDLHDTVLSLRGIGVEGRLHMGQHEYWMRIISAWLAVGDSSIEEDIILSGLLATSRSILMEEKGDDANFPEEVLVLGSGEHRDIEGE